MKVTDFNILDEDHAMKEILNCCGSSSWAKKMVMQRPFHTIDEIIRKSDSNWYECNEQDWLEAFSHHPKIGDKESLKKKFSHDKWAGKEQSGVDEAAEEIINQLAIKNQEYEKQFGYIFIVCATGKSASEMLQMLELRLHNAPEEEIRIAMEEQKKITHIRINKLFA